MSNEEDRLNIILKKSFRGELYDITFTTKGNIFGELKNKQEGNTLTLEQLLTEFLIIHETTDDDKSLKRTIRTKFLLACYYEKNHLQKLFEEFTTFLNGGANENTAFIINVSGGNLVILFAYLIIDIKNMNVPKVLIDYFTHRVIEDSYSEIDDNIIELAKAVITPSKSVVFSDLDFYIIKNSKYKETNQEGGGGKRELDDIGSKFSPSPKREREFEPKAEPESQPKAEPELRRGNRIRTKTITLLETSSKEYDLLNEKLKKKKKLREEQKKEERQLLRTQEAEKKQQIQRKVLDGINLKTKTIPQRSSESEKQGFCVYRIKTEAQFDDYLDFVLEDWPNSNIEEEPKPLKEFKDTLLDLFCFYVENESFSILTANTYITEEDYNLLYKDGLPTTIGKGKGKIEIYPQLFQEKFLDNKNLSDGCKLQLKHLEIKKNIIEAAKNLNIYLLIECLKTEYNNEDHYNLMLFLNKLSIDINDNLQSLNNDPDIDLNFDSLDKLRENLVTKIIENVSYILYNNKITTAIKNRLGEYLTYYKSEQDTRPPIELRRSKSIIKSNPQIDINMKDAIIKDKIFLYFPDAETPVYADEELFNYVENVDVDMTTGGGKKLKKSKKKRNVYKKTRKKHNKKINIENPYNSKKLIKNKKTRKKHNKKKRETIKKLKK